MLAKLLRRPSVNRTLVFSASTALISGGVVLTAAPSSAAACASFSGGGDGSSAAQAIHISTAADLNLLQATSSCWASGIYFQQQENIDMGNAVWSSGIGRQEVRAFAGTYDGNGKSVGGLTVRSSDLYVGLFGYVTGSIDSLGFTGDVEGTRAQSGGGPYIGGLVGTATGPVSNSFSTGNVTCDAGSGQYQCFAGGLVGLNGSAITSSYSTGVVTTSYARDASAGGLVGTMSVGSISDSYSLATVQDAAGSARMMLGGLVGNTQSGISISRTYATGPVRDLSGTAYIGGLLGRDGGVTLANTYWDSDIALTDATACVGYTGTDPSGCTAATDDELKTLGTFSGFSITTGFDAGSTWGICSAVNDGYPFLTAFYSSDPCSNPPSPSAGDYSRPTATFHFRLPDGTECSAISPQLVYAYTTYILPGQNAPCRPPGSELLGWSVYHQDWDFAPGATVYVIESQVFTAVLRHPVVKVVWESNVPTEDTCLRDPKDTNSNASASQRTDTTYLERAGMADPRTSYPSLETYLALSPAPCSPPGMALRGWEITTPEGPVTVTPGGSIAEAITAASPKGADSEFTFRAVWAGATSQDTLTRAGFYEAKSNQLSTNGQQDLRELLAAVPEDATNITVEIIGVSNSLDTPAANKTLATERTARLERELQNSGLTGTYRKTTDPTLVTPNTSSTEKQLSTVRITFEVVGFTD